MIAVGDKRAVLVKGDYEPAELYAGETKITGWQAQDYAGREITVEDTYNDRLCLTAHGEHAQNGEPSPDNPVEIEALEALDANARTIQLLKGTRTLEKNDEVAALLGTVQSSEIYRGCYTVWTNYAWHGYKINFKKIAERVGIKVGDTITYSIWIRYDGVPIKNPTISLYAYSPSGSIAGISSKIITPSVASLEDWQQWHQCKWTYIVTDALMECTILRIESNYYEISDYTTVQANAIFACPMLEFGDTAHDWVPYYEPQSVEQPFDPPLYGANGVYDTWENDVIVDGVRRSRTTRWFGTTVIDGDSIKFTVSADVIFWNLPKFTSPGIMNGYVNVWCTHFAQRMIRGNADYDFAWTTQAYMAGIFDTVDELNAFCVAQYAAGTPVTIVYQRDSPEVTLSDPVPLRTHPRSTVLTSNAEISASIKTVEM